MKNTSITLELKTFLMALELSQYVNAKENKMYPLQRAWVEYTQEIRAKETKALLKMILYNVSYKAQEWKHFRLTAFSLSWEEIK